MRKKSFLFLIGLLISGACLYWAIRGISIHQTISAVRQADCRWIALALFFYYFAYLSRALRWKVLLKPVKTISTSELFGPLVIGFFANNILPFRMGELVRAHLCGRKFNISRTASIGTIFLERLYDTLSLLLAFLAVAFILPFPLYVKRGATLMGVACILLVICIILVIKYEMKTHYFLDKLPLPPHLITRAHHLLSNFVHGVSGMTDISYITSVLLLSLLVWTIEGTALYLIGRAFPVHYNYPQAFFLMFILGLSVLLPQAPGYVGTIELAGVTALSLLGIDKAYALPLILTVHSVQFLFILLLGIFCLWKEGLTFRQLLH